jgi:ABC-type dipeptide/oligopeptide/nickel transport system permease component
MLGVVLVIGLVIVVANLIIDLVVAWMDPRAAEAGTRSSVVGRVA